MAAPSGGEEEATPPKAGVTVKEIGDARIIEAVLPGRALGTTVPPGGGVAVLIAAQGPEGARSLYRFDPSGDGSLTELARGLPPELDAIAHLDLDGDGRYELIVGEPGRIHSLGALDDAQRSRRPRLLLEAPRLDLKALRRRGLIHPDHAFIPRARVGRLETYRLGAGPTMELANTVDLPVQARRERHGLRLSSPPVHLLERPDAELPLLAVGPVRQGKRRLLTTLVDPSADPESGNAEAWSQLPANERVEQSWYLAVDGRPLLAVATLNADKMGIFEKKKLRVFPLRTDRTRAGSRPVLEILTATRNWYDLGVHVADLDLDGHEDLIVIQPDGLGRKKLAVEAYRGKGNAGFFLTPRRSVMVAPEARWIFGHDLDGDRVPDLVIDDDDGRLLVFRGLASSKKLVVEKKPHWSFEAWQPGEVPDSEVTIRLGDDDDNDEDSDDSDARMDFNRKRPLVVDVDGDGRGEILLRGERGGRALIRVIALR